MPYIWLNLHATTTNQKMKQKVIIKRLLFFLFFFSTSILAEAQSNSLLSPPITKNDSVLIGKNQSIEINILANDSDPDGDINQSSIQILQNPQIGLFQIIGKKIKYTPGTNQCGLDSIKYRLTDQNNEVSNVATIYIEVTCFNLAPIALNDNLVLDEDTKDSIDIFDNDKFTDGPGIKLDIINNSKSGLENINLLHFLVYTPKKNFFGNDTILYSFCDLDPTNPLCDSAYIYITVNPINDKPIAKRDSLKLFESQTINTDVSINDKDVDGPGKSYTLLTPSINGSANLSPVGILNYSPNTGFIGKDSIRYILCDNGIPNLCDTNIVFLEVEEIFEKPVSLNDTLYIPKDSAGIINILKNDIYTNGLNTDSVFFLNIPGNGTFSYLDSTVTFRPTIGFVGELSIYYYLRDLKDSISNISTIFIKVNQIPSAMDRCGIQTLINQSILINPFEFALNGTEAIDKSKIDLVAAPEKGLLSNYNPINNFITYTPNNNFIGIDSFIYRIYDVDGLKSNNILICIEIINEIPVKTNGIISPNGDGINDILTFENIDNYPDNEVIIFDRNWNEVFHVNAYSSTNYWDAQNLGTGTYYYYVKIKLNNQEKIIKGYISLLK